MNAISSQLVGKCRVFDPQTSLCHDNLSSIDTSQVILYGELHHTDVLNVVQEEILDLVNRTNRTGITCLLLEGWAVGEELKAEDFLDFCVSKNVVIRGADNRVKPQSEISAKLYVWNRKKHEINQRKREAVRRFVKKSAEILNKQMHFGRMSYEKAIFSVNPGTRKTISELNQQLITPVITMLKEHVKQGEKFPKINQSLSDVYNLGKMNTVFADEVIKACKQHSKVFGRLGRAHFTEDDTITKRLRLANISFTVLMPTQQQVDLANKEFDWYHHEEETLNLTLRDIHGESVFTIPKEFVNYFELSLQKELLSESKILVLDARFFAEVVAKRKLELEFDKPIQFVNISHFRAKRLQNFSEKKQQEQIDEELLEILQDCLFFNGLRLVKLESQNLEVNQKDRSIVISTNGSLKMVLRDDLMITQAGLMLEEMLDLEHLLVRVLPSQKIAFTDVYDEELKSIIENPNRFPSVLSKRVPQGYEIKLSGDLTVFSSKDAKPVLIIETKNGASIELVKKP